MASPIHGRRGRLYVGIASGGLAEPIANLKSWSITFDVDKIETTVFGDTNKTYVSGLPNAEGDYAGFYDTATEQLYTASQDGIARKMYLYPSTADGDYFFGTALFDFGLQGAVDAAVECSGSWAAATSIIKVSG